MALWDQIRLALDRNPSVRDIVRNSPEFQEWEKSFPRIETLAGTLYIWEERAGIQIVNEVRYLNADNPRRIVYFEDELIYAWAARHELLHKEN